MWCEVHSHGIVVSYFFEKAKEHTVTVNAERYKVMLATFLCTELHPCQQDLLWFQQNGATAHTAEFPCKSSGERFRADSFLVSGTSPGPLAHLTMQNQTTSSGAT
jgi:hypothetical protein